MARQSPPHTPVLHSNSVHPHLQISKGTSRSSCSFRSIRPLFKVQSPTFVLLLCWRRIHQGFKSWAGASVLNDEDGKMVLVLFAGVVILVTMSEAYRRRGWAFKNPDSIEQCKREGFSQKMQEQKNEGCQVYGFLEVNKVRESFYCEPAAWWWGLWKSRVKSFLSFSRFRCSQDCHRITSGISKVFVLVMGFRRTVRKSSGKRLILVCVL